MGKIDQQSGAIPHNAKPKREFDFRAAIKKSSIFSLFISFCLLCAVYSHKAICDKEFKRIRSSIDTMRFERIAKENGQMESYPIKEYKKQIVKP